VINIHIIYIYVCLTLVQSGKFDNVDCLFQSMESAYINSLSNTSDVKELIPEFFYMSEFPENSNSYHLGVL
jgi:hypothetical protein